MFKKENIKKDFWKIFFPILVIFYIFIAYNLVDVFFAGLISEKAIAWLQVAFPMFFLLLAFNEWFWTAMNNLASISLWEKKKENISKYFTVWLILSLILWFIFFVFSENIANIFMYFLWDLDNEIKNYAFLYWNILIKYSFLYVFWWIIWQLLIVFKKRKAQIFLAVSILLINIILDYLFVKIYNFWIEWIAFATVFTWLFILFFWLYYIILREKITYFTKNINYSNFKRFLSFTISVFLIYLFVMWVIMIDNYFFAKIWAEALSSYGIGSRLKDLLFYLILWFSISFSVLYGFFHWEKDYETMKNIINYAIRIWLFYSILLVFILPLIWKLFWWFFTDNLLTLKYLFYYMIFSSIAMFGYVFEFIYSSVLQIREYHKTRIFLNFLYLIFVFIFEYIFYNLYWTYVSIWIWSVIASLSISYLTYLYYKVKVEK